MESPTSSSVPRAGKRRRRRGVLPGFGLTLGYTVLYLSLIVLIPLSALFFKTATAPWEHIWETISSPRVLASFRLTLGASLVAALINAVFGLGVAWMNEDSPAEGDFLAGGQFGDVVVQVGVERALTKRVEGEQAIIPHVPVGGKAGIRGMVEDGHTEPFTLHYTGVVDPRRAFTPSVHHPGETFGVDDLATPTFGELLGQADGEGAFLGVAEGDIHGRGQGNHHVDDAEFAFGAEDHVTVFDQQSLAAGIAPIHHGRQRAE